MINGNGWNKYRKSNQVPFPTILPHLENGINRRRFRVARAGYISSRSNHRFRYRERNRKSSAECTSRRGRGEEKGAMVIDYANDQLGERSSDSSPAAKAIAVWQFAAVQVYLTRFWVAIAGRKKRKERQKENRSDREGKSIGASSSRAGLGL